MSKILCIDDNMDICLLLSKYLKRHNHEVDTALTGNSGLKLIKENRYDLVLCDFRLPDKDGLEMIRSIRELSPGTQIIIITGYSDVKVAVKAIKYGAFEYVTKPIHPEEILVTINSALKKTTEETIAQATEPGTVSAKRKTKQKKVSDVPAYIKGSGESSKQMHQLMDLVAPTDMTVVVLGESGTGKEVTARIIHEKSKRNDKPFVAVDCGALPNELARSELFGHKKGSFTGALQDKTGHFQMADGGTLFLDEIGNLNYDNQVKLLRALQERKIRKLGDQNDIDVDIRVIVATNEDLKQAVKNGEFREDLYFRINEFKIELPSIRERKSDIMDFASHFLTLANNELDREVEGFSEQVKLKFKEYFWPGNLREMRNVVRRAVLLCRENEIQLDQLPQEILHPEYLSIANADEMAGDLTDKDLKTIVEHAEKRAILAVLEKTGRNKSRTAKILNIDRKTLYNKMNAYDIDFS